MEEEKKKTEELEESESVSDEVKEEAVAEPEPKPEPESEPQPADTPAAEEPKPEPQPAAPAEPQPEPERTFTQEQVNALVGKARAEGREKGYEQARREALERYGVESDDELDGLFADGSRYGELSSRYEDERGSLAEARTELALVKSGVLPERQGDVKAILGANGMEVTVENIESLLPTHPEWKGATQLPAQTPAPAPIPQPEMVPQPQPDGNGSRSEGDLGPQPKPAGLADDGEDEDRQRKEAMRKFGLL